MTKKEKENWIKERKIKCIHMVEDGCGVYCGLRPMNKKEILPGFEYPHKFFRTDCYGRKMLCRFKEDHKEAGQ